MERRKRRWLPPCRRATRRRSPRWWSATSGSCKSTATGCSAPWRTPRTWCRRRCCAPGGNASSASRAAPAPGVAVPDRHQRLPGRPGGQARRPWSPVNWAPHRSTGDLGVLARPRDRLAAALPGPAAGGGRARRHRAGGHGRGQGDDRAGLLGRHSAAAAQPAGGADPARRAGLVGQRDRLAARYQRRLGQQRPPACTGDDQAAPAGRRLEWAPSRHRPTRSVPCSSGAWTPSSGPTPPRSPSC